MENVLILVGLFVICFFVVGVGGLILYAVLLAIHKNLNTYQHIFTKKRLKIISLLLPLFCASYLAFTAVYPTDDFYFDEFETITSRKIPTSAKVLEKSATYPDLHGDYESNATITLSSSDYQQLFQQIQQDKRFEKLPRQLTDNKIEFLRMVENREDRLYYVAFYTDGKTIGIHLINN